MNKRKYDVWFDEICLGKQSIRNVGNSFVITIPKKIVKNNNLTKGESVIPIIIVRKRKLAGELKDDEEWVKMSKKDRIMFNSYLKEMKELEHATKKR